MKSEWDTRYNTEEFIYGKAPNMFFADFLLNSKEVGKILLPAEGEGRNAVFAASVGWEVDAFDFSEAAQYKALKYAKESFVDINYFIQDFGDLKLNNQYYDCIALIYNHIERQYRIPCFEKYYEALKPGGFLIFEGFSKEQIHFKQSGGPKIEHLLYSIEEIEQDFAKFTINEIKQQKTFLNEGKLHYGISSIIRMIASK